jgi:hypothetical protein
MYKIATAVLAGLALLPTASIIPALAVGITLKLVVDASYPNGGGPSAEHRSVQFSHKGQVYQYEELALQEIEVLEKYLEAASAGAPRLLDEWIEAFPRT